MSDSETSQDADKTARRERLAEAVEEHAKALGFQDYRDALRPEVFEAARYGMDGKPVAASIKEALDKLAEAKPYLLKPSGDPTRPLPSGPKSVQPKKGLVF
jgi:hypothetical protein